jgi:hypothetical protein
MTPVDGGQAWVTGSRMTLDYGGARVNERLKHCFALDRACEVAVLPGYSRPLARGVHSVAPSGPRRHGWHSPSSSNTTTGHQPGGRPRHGTDSAPEGRPRLWRRGCGHPHAEQQEASHSFPVQATSRTSRCFYRGARSWPPSPHSPLKQRSCAAGAVVSIARAACYRVLLGGNAPRSPSAHKRRAPDAWTTERG